MVHEIRDGTLADLFLWLLRWRRRLRIVGLSMQPLLQPGDEVLVDVRAYRRSLPTPGDIVVLQHPHQPQLRIVKRAVAITPAGDCFVQGDNPSASTDSRTFGCVQASLILGKVVCRFL